MLDVPPYSFSMDQSVSRKYDKARSLIETDRERAISILKENCIKDCSSSMVLLGILMSDGTPDEREYSFHLFETSVAYNNSYGVLNLAYCYALGLNCTKNKTKALELYIQAAEMGNAKAACNVGVLYEYGNGVSKDLKEAFRWYLKSAENGYDRGMTNLGEMYLEGKGTERNIKEAEKWLTKSGSSRALYRLAEMYLDDEDHMDRIKGMSCLERSARSGYSKAMYRYGRIIEDEYHDEAVELYNQAAKKNNRDAVARLQELGLPVPEPMFRK